MAVTITQQPVDSIVTVGSTHSFTVAATATNGTLRYEWFYKGVATGFPSAATYDELLAGEDNSYATVYCIVYDDDNIGVQTDIVLAISLKADVFNNLHALVFNYDDNNFTWKDPAVEQGNEIDGYKLYDVTFQTYGFTPGFQERWSDYGIFSQRALDWNDAKADGGNPTRWTDTFSKSNSKEIVQVTNGLVYTADQVDNRYGALKQFFIERTQMDMDDMVPDWTTNKVKQIKQFVFHMQSDERRITVDPNEIDFYVGWSTNLMDEPNWKAPVQIDLRSTDNGGQYKVDYRTSGRYLSMRYDLTDSKQLAFTGGDIDAKEAAGR